MVVESRVSVVLEATVEAGGEEEAGELSPCDDVLSTEELLGGAVIED